MTTRKLPYLKFEDSPELQYMRERRMALGGYLPSRRTQAEPLAVPALSAFDALLKASGEGRELSTTMAIRAHHEHPAQRQADRQAHVPIVPDESRTFGMEGMFRQIGIWNQEGQKYVPQDADQLMFYKESKPARCCRKASTKPARWPTGSPPRRPTRAWRADDPVYIFYSMFGFSARDLCWAAGDQRSRGFLIGGTAGRTTLNGEGLQHEDGHSHLWWPTIPNCISYDPTFQYEVAVIVQDGLRRMFAEQEDVFYYLTVMNENYEHPGHAGRRRSGHPQGHVPVPPGADKRPARAIAGLGHDLPRGDCGRRPAAATTGVSRPTCGAARASTNWPAMASIARWNLLHPMEAPKSHVQTCLKDTAAR
jgi:pyruvate dehydrogenase E1 component